MIKVKPRSVVGCFLFTTMAGVTIVAAVAVGRASAASIGEEATLRYSGTLEDESGAADDSEHAVELALFEASSGGVALCPSTSERVQIGPFSSSLDAACTAAIADHADLWTEISIDGERLPRSSVAPVPFAVEAQHAARATTAQALEPGPIQGGLQVFSVGNDAIDGTLCRFGQAGAPFVVDCQCPEGTFIVSGGADAGGGSGSVVRESRPKDPSTWRFACANGSTDVFCVTYNFSCSRLGP